MLRVEAGLSSVMNKYDQKFKVGQIGQDDRSYRISSTKSVERPGLLKQISFAMGFSKKSVEYEVKPPEMKQETSKETTLRDDDKKQVLAAAKKAAIAQKGA